MPRILSVDNTFTFGGAINSLAYLVRGLDSSRFEVTVLSAQSQTLLDRLFPTVEAKHWSVRLNWVHDPIHRRVVSLPGFKRGLLRGIWEKLRAVAWIMSVDLPDALRIVRYVRRRQVDLIHLNNGIEGLLPALLAAKLTGVPAVAHVRSPQRLSGIAASYARIPAHWIAVSSYIAEDLERQGVDRRRISVVHDAIDNTEFSEGSPPRALRDDLGVRSGSPIFGFFGRVIPWKGVREFIEAAAIVLKARPDALALIVGDPSDGAENHYHNLQQMVHTAGLGQHILFTGYRSDVADLMRLCDVVVHSSVVPEPFGMTVIEGMATGTPVVAADSGGPTEIVDHGETGLLVDPRDATALSSAILDLLENPGEARAMGRRGAQRVRDYYSIDRYAREVEVVFDRLL